MQRIAVARLQPRLAHEVEAAYDLAVLIGPCKRKCARSQQCHIHTDCISTAGPRRSGMHNIHAMMAQAHWKHQSSRPCHSNGEVYSPTQ